MLRQQRITIKQTVTVILIAILFNKNLLAQKQTPFQFNPLNRITQTAIIDSVCQALSDIYVFPEKADAMEKYVKGKLKKGKYDKITELRPFTFTLTEDLRSICQDRHLRVMPLQTPSASAEPLSPDQERQQWLENLKMRNYGFQKVELLPGNVGYLKLNMFADASYAGKTAIAAMNYLAYCSALIIDLRENGGGSPSMIQLITSYFFNEPKHLNSFYIRKSNTTKQFWTQSDVQGPRLLETPIYILTSQRTFSAAEEFTYNLKNMERATIVGETTGGGAHPVESHIFPSLHVRMSVPFGRAINPITQTNWEGVGIKPHVKVPAGDALLQAQLLAIRSLTQTTENPERKKQLTWVQNGIEARLNHLTLDIKTLEKYVGQYGPRRIFLEGPHLIYHREGRPKYKLAPMVKDTFFVEGLDFFRICFTRDDEDRVTALVGLYDSGQTDKNQRND
jgi:hypothetical protein